MLTREKCAKLTIPDEPFSGLGRDEMKEMLSDEGYDEDEFEDELGEEEAEQLEDPVLPAGAAACGEFRQDIPRIGKSNSISPNFWHYVKGFEAWILNIELFESSDGENIVSSIRQDVVGSISLFYGWGFSLFYKVLLVLQKNSRLSLF